jgi:hypothetical protein
VPQGHDVPVTPVLGFTMKPPKRKTVSPAPVYQGTFAESVYPFHLDWEDEEDEDWELPLYRHRRPFHRVRPSVGVIRIMDIKRAQRAAQSDARASSVRAGELTETLERTWGRIGLTVVIGLIIAVLGGAIHFAVSGPFPVAVGTFGMLLVVIALWYGGRLQTSSEHSEARPEIVGKAA